MNLSVSPFELEVDVRVCLPMLSWTPLFDDGPPHLNTNISLKAHLIMDNVHFKRWNGIRLHGEGFVNTVLQLASKLDFIGHLISRMTEKWMKKELPRAFERFIVKLNRRIDHFYTKIHNQSLEQP